MRYIHNANENKDLNELAKETDMRNAQLNSSVAMSGATAAALDDMLDDLELDGLDSGEVSDDIEEIVTLEADSDEAPAVTDEDLENVDLDDLEMSIDREDGYAAQESEVNVTERAAETAAAAKTQSASTPRAPRAARTPSAPRTPRDMASLDAKVFVLEGDAATMDDTQLDINKLAVMATVPTQKKIAEKFENLFAALHAGKQPSVYTVAAFKLLNDRKTVTGADITTMFKASHSQGTAQSQAGQMMNLFATTKVAERQKNTLVLNENSVVAQRLRDILYPSS
jgi:hypothetical protein